MKNVHPFTNFQSLRPVPFKKGGLPTYNKGDFSQV